VAEATDAHILLRNALDILLLNQNPPLPSFPTYFVSHDFKMAKPTAPTTFDGEQIPGIPGISDFVSGGNLITVELNGIALLVGDGCNAATFGTPKYHILFAKKFTNFTFTVNSITFTSGLNDFVFGDSVILIDNGVCICRDVVSVSLNTIILSSPITGPVTFVARPKKLGKIAKGDIPLWFGSFATYELDTIDTLVYKYLTQI
jgi:hypothetical protein